jgi:hypothetical protein
LHRDNNVSILKTGALRNISQCAHATSR